jgi:4-amino-4-deoxy-L-arabinose transferase-like glycosyltransferase
MPSLRTRLSGSIVPCLLAFGGGFGTLTLMANGGQLPHGALLGGGCLLLCVLGLLRLLGLLPDAGDDAEPLPLALAPMPGERRALAPAVTVPVAAVLVLASMFALGGHALPLGLTLALLLLLPAALHRPALLVFVIGSALYLPPLGAYGLWDPWETHYGEVAREMLSRDDWLSLWWAQDKWFWSKPIFIFWVEGLLWSASGIPFLPDSQFQHTEWVLRLPTFAVAMLGLLSVHAAVRKLVGERPALLATIVLATTPYYGFLTRQAITDMPFVGTMTAAIMLLLLAVAEDPERTVKRYRVFRFAISAHELLLGALLLVCLPQILYLVSRNVTLDDGLFAWHRDRFLFGSGHNPDVPGNPGLRDELPRYVGIAVQPAMQALWWASGLGLIVLQLRRERRAQSLYMLGFYVLCALSFMAKGIPGFALPGLVALLYLIGSGRFSLLLEGRLRVALGVLTIVVVSLPWFVAMYVRHGAAFTNRILIHDHLNRLAKGVHGDTGSIQYFVAQLGYGTFPWIGLIPLGLGAWLWSARSHEPASPEERARRDTLMLVALWFIAAFTLYSAMVTKFHHYVFPAVPAAAILIGVVLDRMLGPAPSFPHAWATRLLAWIAPLPLLIGIGGLRGDLRGILPAGLSAGQRAVWALQNGMAKVPCAMLIGLGLFLLVSAAALDRRQRERPTPSDPVLSAALVASALVTAFVGRDLSWVTAQRPAGYERLIHLFVYNYERPWPSHFDYRPVLTGFAVTLTLLLGLCALRALRPMATQALLAGSIFFSVWMLDVYMIDLSPHWSQRDLVARYYKERKSPKEPLVAWQMNWKGENFYTGNRVAVFVSLNNKEMSEWLDKKKGVTAYFVLEHGRLPRLKTTLGSRKVVPLTTDRDNNKFVLVKAKL